MVAFRFVLKYKIMSFFSFAFGILGYLLVVENFTSKYTSASSVLLF